MRYRSVAWAGVSLMFTCLASPAALAQAPTTKPATTATSNTCADCGIVRTINYSEQKGQGSGVGLVAGGVLGGVLGHQIGSGRGNTVATVAGVGVGALAGNEVEKNVKKTGTWSVSIRMDSGNTRTFNYSAQPTVREGERVKLVDGGKRLALLSK